MIKHLHYFLFVSFVITSCYNEPSKTVSNERVPQSSETRTVNMVEYDSLRFIPSDGRIFTTQNYKIVDDFLFISHFQHGKVFQYKLSTGKFVTTFGDSIGRGPGQFQRIKGLDVFQNKLAIYDEDLFKVSLFNIETAELLDEFVLDVRPQRLQFLNESTLIIASAMSADRFISRFDMNDESLTTIYVGFGETGPLKYEGFIATNDESVVFAGYSEPMLVRANLDGSLAFTRKAIEAYETDLNYSNRSGDQQISSYTNVAQFNALAVAISGKYIIVHAVNNALRGDKSYIDVYDLASGDYLISVNKPDKPVGGLTIQDQKLTFISYEDEAIVFYLVDIDAVLSHL